jgi:hypothetical protein
MVTECEHPLCKIIGGACSLATRRSRGCRPNVASKDVAPEVLDEVRELRRARGVERSHVVLDRIGLRVTASVSMAATRRIRQPTPHGA